MSIAVVCPQGHHWTVPDRHAGETVACPDCSCAVEVPFPAITILPEGYLPAGENPADFPAPEPQEAPAGPSCDRPSDLDLLGAGLTLRYVGVLMILLGLGITAALAAAVLYTWGLVLKTSLPSLVGVGVLILAIGALALDFAGAGLGLAGPGKLRSFLAGSALLDLAGLGLLLGLAVAGDGGDDWTAWPGLPAAGAAFLAWVFFLLFLKTLAGLLGQNDRAGEAVHLLARGAGLAALLAAVAGAAWLLEMYFQPLFVVLYLLVPAGYLVVGVFQVLFRQARLIDALRRRVTRR